MHRRTRKFVGTLIMLVFVLVYAFLVTRLAAPILTDATILVKTLFYAIAGLAWVPPLMWLIKWMEGGKDATRPSGRV